MGVEMSSDDRNCELRRQLRESVAICRECRNLMLDAATEIERLNLHAEMVSRMKALIAEASSMNSNE